jgi:uncharacterized membrane protein YgdD (TMEM256/DUF423 family)
MKINMWLSLSAISMALAVGLGAFGAHALASVLDVKQLATWQTAVQYHLIHGVALFSVAIWLQGQAPLWAAKIAWGLLLGTLLFSGSLYVWVLTGWHPLVFVTPIGGSVWLLTWLGLAWKAMRNAEKV